VNPAAEPAAERGAPEWWDARYLSGDIPWDTGIVPPEVAELVESGEVAPGRALDIGCGSGLSSRYLAQQGFSTVGVDLSHVALARAAALARREGLRVLFCQADVTDLGFLSARFSVAVDVGCFHAVSPERRSAYVASLAARLDPGGWYLLYAFEPAAGLEDGPAGIGPAEIAAFAPAFSLCSARHGTDGERRSAWYLMRRA
jgi:SAM-dependent methyltransferase